LIDSRPSRRPGAAAPLWAGAALGLLFAGCGSRENNGLGVGLIAGEAETKAVRIADLSPPDTSVDFQLTSPGGTAGVSSSLLLGRESGLVSRALLRFDLTPLPDSGQGSTLDTAFVRLVYDEGFGDPQSLTVTVHRVLAPWGENIVSVDSLFPAISPALDTVSLAVSVTGDSTSVPLTELTRFWLDRPDSNFGMALVPDDATNAMLEFMSGENATPPSLVATWSQSGTDTTAIATTTDDTHFLGATTGFVPLDQEPGRLAVARGLPSRALLKFAIPDFGPRATINRAEITLYADQSLSRLVDFTIGAQRITEEPWKGDSTTIDTFFEGITTVDASTDSAKIVVTTIVTRIVEEENHGIVIRPSIERVDADFIRFHAHDSAVIERRPRLTIWYTAGDAPEDLP
jgi:hypothetical protein